MQILINIPDEIYSRAIYYKCTGNDIPTIMEAIKDGVPLEKIDNWITTPVIEVPKLYYKKVKINDIVSKIQMSPLPFDENENESVSVKVAQVVCETCKQFDNSDRYCKLLQINHLPEGFGCNKRER